MLATYFKQYPPSLAAEAKRQAEVEKMSLGSPEETQGSLQAPMEEDEAERKSESDSGRTYTVSDKSEAQEEANGQPQKRRTPSPPSNFVLKELSPSLEIRTPLEPLKQLNLDLIPPERQNSPPGDSSSSSDEDFSTTTHHLASPTPPQQQNLNLSTPPVTTPFKLSSPPPTSPSPPYKISSPPPQISTSSHHEPSPARSGTHSGCPIHGSSPSRSPPKQRTRVPSSGSSTRSSAAESQLLHCGICQERFKNPKVLPCLHTFCEKCLLSYSPPESLTLTCPLCRQQSILPKDGVRGLQTNRWVSGMMEAMEVAPTSPTPVPTPCSKCGGRPNMTCIQCSVTLCKHCAAHHEKDCGRLPKSSWSNVRPSYSEDSSTLANSNSCFTCGDKSNMTCLDCEVILCKKCADLHQKSSGDRCHSVIPIGSLSSHASSDGMEDTTLYCPSHEGQTLRFYCRDCETAVCSSCTDIEHRRHVTLRLGEGIVDQRAEMHKLVNKLTAQLPMVKEALCDLSDTSFQLGEKQNETEGDVRLCFEALHLLIDERQAELIKTLKNLVTQKKKTIEEQRKELEGWISGVESGCEFVEKALNDCPAMELLLVRKQLGERLADYSNMNIPPVPRENAHVQFVLGNIDPLKTALGHVGSIQSNSAVSHQTTAMGEALKRAPIGRQMIVTVITRDHKGDPVRKGGGDVTASLTRPHTTLNGHHGVTNGDASTQISPGSTRCNSRTDGTCDPQVLDLNNGTYEISFTLFQEGSHSLSILLYGQHINASPFSISSIGPDLDDVSERSSQGGRSPYVTRQTSRSTQLTKTSKNSRRPPSHKSSCSRKTNPIEDDLVLKIGRRGRNRGEFVNPQGICYSTIREGRIAVADSNNQCILVFTLSGECKLRFGVRGRTAGQLQRPTGVAAMENGNYVVADYENKWVSIFEPTGKYISRIGYGKLIGPKGVCVDKKGHIIVVDNKSSCVCVFTPSGKLLSKFGNRGMDENSFAGPHFCAVNSQGEIIVTDFHNHCVKVFDSSGEYLYTFGTSGEGNGQFNAPTGIAIDENDNILVADWGNSRIQIFDRQGSFLSFVNTQADPLFGPQGLTLTADGQVVVADSGNHCLKMYKYLQ